MFQVITVRKPWGYEELALLDGALVRLTDLREWMTETQAEIVRAVPLFPQLWGASADDRRAPSALFVVNT